MHKTLITTHVCNACDGPVRFVNRKPLNPDGTDHWDVCKQRQFAKVMKHGQPYRTESEAGYIYKGENYRTWIRGPRVIGQHYQQSCDCETPPWEECTHTLAA